MADPTWRKANFLWKFLCAGGASADCGGDPIPTAVPPQGFLQSKNALRRRKTVSSLPGSLIVERIAYRIAAAIQKESAGKNRRSLPQWLDTSCLEPMGSHKGPQTLLLCCAASATKAISSRRLDTALLCAAKKRGVEKNQLAGFCQFDPVATAKPCHWQVAHLESFHSRYSSYVPSRSMILPSGWNSIIRLHVVCSSSWS